LGVIVIVAMGLGAAPWSAGQGRPQLKRPEQAPQEKPPAPKKKPVKGPRAVGILQISGGKMTLIPVAILVEKKFYDASVYKAAPVPMALERGTVYEAERNGESQGLFTINGALHSKNPGSVSPWLGAGSYLANGTEAAKTTRKAEDVPVGLDNSGDEPPRLTRGNAAKGTTPAQSEPGKSSPASGQNSPKDASAPAAAPSTDKSAGQGSAAQVPASTEKKTVEQGAPGQSSPAQSSSDPGSGSPSSGNPGSRQAAKGEAAPSAGQPEQTAENYYRPTLRRGKPTQAAPEEEDASPVASKSADGGKTTAPATEPVQLEAAISDAGGPEPRSYKYFWKEGEEDDRRKQMLELAANEVKAYLNARAKGAIPAKGPVTKGSTATKNGAATHKVIAKVVEPEFENVQFQGFDVWTNNQLVMILSAEANLPAGSSAALEAGKYRITLAARTDIYGNLRKLYSGVTDRFHLDVTPRLELIDVVDADGDGRGELLFRETSDVGSGYVIYRATGDTLWKMFDSLGGE
jgi:hypothetical protein